MNLLILGSGGREHAFAWKLAQSPLCEKLFIAPGNAGTSLCGTNVPIGVNDFESIASLCREQAIDLVLVGPEEPCDFKALLIGTRIPAANGHNSTGRSFFNIQCNSI